MHRFYSDGGGQDKPVHLNWLSILKGKGDIGVVKKMLEDLN